MAPYQHQPEDKDNEEYVDGTRIMSVCYSSEMLVLFLYAEAWLYNLSTF